MSGISRDQDVSPPMGPGMAPTVPAFDVSTEAGPDGRPRAVAVSGELDIAAAPDVGAAVRRAQAAGDGMLVLDLSEVIHLDSSGLRVLLDAAARARQRERRLVIVAPPEGPVGRLLELTLLADHLDVVRDRDGIGP